MSLIHDDISSLSAEEKNALLQIALEMEKEGRSPTLEAIIGMEYDYILPDMETFLTHPYYLGATGKSIYPKLMDDLIEIFDGGPYIEIHLTGGIGWGKCVAEGTLISTSLGKKRIEDLEGLKGYEVYGFDSRFVLKKVVVRDFICSGKKDVVKVTLQSGRSIRVTPGHPILTDSGYVKAEELGKGQFIACWREGEGMALESKERPVEDVLFAAYALAEGAVGEGNSSLTNGTPEVVDDMVKSLRAVGGKGKVTQQGKHWKIGIVERGKRLLDEWGIKGKLSKEKRLPLWVFNLPKSQKKLFINRFWACDGSLYCGKVLRIECQLASEGLIDDLMELLWEVGIHSRKTPRIVRNDGKAFKSWRLQIADGENIVKFLLFCGPILGKEDASKRLLENARKRKSNTNHDVVPFDYGRMKAFRKAVGGMSRAEWEKWKVPEGQFMGYAKAREMVKRFFRLPIPSDYDFTSPHVRWDQVKSVVPDGEARVFDLDVPETKNFVIGGGVAVHNSTVAEFIMARMIAECWCHKDPASAFGLMPGSTISFVNISVNEAQARRVIFKGLHQKISRSPFFNEHCRPDSRVVTELRFPKELWMAPLASTDSSALGLDLWGGIMDECVTGNTMILMGDGSLKEAKELSRGDKVQYVDFASGNSRYDGVVDVKKSGVQECIGVYLENGLFVEASWHHPILVEVDGKLTFKLLCDIIQGDRVVCLEQFHGKFREYMPSRRGGSGFEGGMAGRTSSTWQERILKCNSVLGETRGNNLDASYTTSGVRYVRVLGPIPTYSIQVDPGEVFIANGVVTHNTNFMTVVEKSKAAGRGNKRFDLAESVYYSIQRRMKSRFMEAGTIPGKLVIVSSKNYPDTFMERRIKEVRDTGEEGVFIRDYATWEPKRPGTYSGVTFPVEAGDIAHSSRILTEEQAALSVGNVVRVPIEFQKDFERDIDQAIRDLAGVATATINPYFKDFDRVRKAVDDRQHPFTVESTTLMDGADFIRELLVEKDPRSGKLRPKISPDIPRWVHVDPSVSGDATGLAMGHVAGLMEIEKKDDDTEEWKREDAPLICIDFMLRIIPPVGGEIRFGSVRQLVYNLTEMGFNIRGVSYDSFQSVEALQHYRERGYQSAQFSVEKEDAYKLLKNAFYEGRMKMYQYAQVLKELRQLEYDARTGKVDHPPGGSKDVADALCGVVVGLMRFMQIRSTINYGVRVF